MTRTRAILPIIALALALAGCSAASAPLETPTPTPTPTQEVMTTVEAAAAYMHAICPANAAIDANNQAFQAQKFKSIVATAAVARDATQAAAKALDEPEADWPEDVAEDVGGVFDALVAETAYFDQVSGARNLNEANQIAPPGLTGTDSAQAVRLRLDLPADTSKGCAAYIDG